ncbi:MAG TPA: bifunctional precorrin-2 dehydrogenase/sirohydrochlorin ferrochelatase [Caulobacteraceae bacterium]|jgi:precorrin-2 dehydrogenase/sirohydrochlorin ferrochelatase|nr:bifunctional precorrin-2 dehydrogenase/sirohydrochlorin ferrochelatase [Caulobacteraceae bacterium]
MNAFPAFIPLYGARIVIVGEGEAAQAKARLVAGSPCEIVSVAETQALEPGVYDGARLVFVAVQDESLAAAAAAAARAAGALVNVVDRQHLGDFHTPAIVDRSPVIAAIGTGGAAPIFATLLRNSLEARWPEGLGRVAALSGELQKTVRAALPDAAARRAYWRRMLKGPAGKAAEDGDLETARTLAIAALDDPRIEGRVLLLEAPPRAELLSLAAVRALAAADRIVAAEDCAPEVLAFARRDAERRQTATAADLAAWAGEGLTVLYVSQASTQAVLEGLSALGVTVERLPVATA